MASRVGRSVQDKVIGVLMAAGVTLWSVASPASDAVAGEVGRAATPRQNPLPQVVAAVLDTGINPYHVQFRDNSALARRHPSTYIDGYPTNAEALNLTLDAPDYETAVLADCAQWQKVQLGKLYWIPGTRIVGAITFRGERPNPCVRGDLPWRILDRQAHGTMVASRMAGATTSVCPECRIVAVQSYDFDWIDTYKEELFVAESGDHSVWVANQSWIDLQSNSWGHLLHGYLTHPQERAKIVYVAERHPTFFAGGNGFYGSFGVAGHPAWWENASGVESVIQVGAHDNGQPTMWSATMSHVVADGLATPVAANDSLDGFHPFMGGGTSGSTPFAAGVMARIVLESRRAVNDTGNGVRQGNLVVAAPSAKLPNTGPLKDGKLSMMETKLVYFHAANARPVEEQPFDGEKYSQVCDPLTGRFFHETEAFIGPHFCTVFLTAPLSWQQIPPQLPAYYFVGYGQVGGLTVTPAMSVVLGKMPLPSRPVEDDFFSLDATVRSLFDEAV